MTSSLSSLPSIPAFSGFIRLARFMAFVAVAGALGLAGALPAASASDEGGEVPCGGDFGDFVGGVRAEALGKGFEPAAVDRFLANVVHDPEIIRRDRSQGIFRKSFIEFSKLVMAEYRLNMGREFFEEHADIFSRAQRTYGVQPGVLLSFLALETDFGLVQGDHNTLNALVTLSHDCRRPELFRPHILAALALYMRDDFDPATTIGAWAGEIGMIQMLPADILAFGQDGDGDGRVDLGNSVADALMTAGRVLQDHGWAPGQPWLIEAIIPQTLDWSKTGLDHRMRVADWAGLGVRARSGPQPDGSLMASILLPHGRHGPAFYAFDNYRLYFEWNRSFVYATTSAFLANLFSGYPMYLDGNAPPPLGDADVRALQAALKERGHDVGKVDGIVGRLTRAAVQAEQIRLGLPADAWPTRELLNRLQ